MSSKICRVKPRESKESAQKVSVEGEPVLAKSPDPEERIGEVSGSRRACCCKGLVQLMSEELMEENMTSKSHRRDSRGSERGHNRKEEEDARTNGMRKKLIDVEYWKEVAKIKEQFKKMKMMKEES